MGGNPAALEKGWFAMKARIFRLATTAALLVIVVEAFGAGAKWG